MTFSNSGLPPEPTPSARTNWLVSFARRLPGWFGVTLIASIVLVFAILVGMFASGVGASAGLLPTGWRLYRDPGGRFTAALPATWRQLAGTEGAFADPQQPLLSVQFSVTVFAAVTYSHTAACSAQQVANTTIAGLPATHDPMFGWLVSTSVVQYQINVPLLDSGPGIHMSMSRSANPTPAPDALVGQMRQITSHILASFTPTPRTRLVCTAQEGNASLG